MENRGIWYWSLALIVVVIGLAVWSLYPPGQKLNLGLDLRGGTTLVYQVDVPKGGDSREVIDSTIEILKKRVDPKGLLNLIWRRLAGNRFEVRMPAPSPQVAKLRKAYLDARDQLLNANLARGRVQQVLDMPADERGESLLTLAKGNTDIEALLNELAAVHKDKSAVQSVFDAAELAQIQAQAKVDALPEDDGDDVRQPLESAAAEALNASVAAAEKLVEARKQLEAAWQTLLATNISPSAFDAALNLPTEPGPTIEPAAGRRQQALDRLMARHPALKPSIQSTADAFAAYEKVKGPLDDSNDLEALLRGSGVLEFRIAPRVGLATEARYRQQLQSIGDRPEAGDEYRWMEIEDLTGFADEPEELKLLEDDPSSYFAGRYAIAGGDKGGLIADRFAGRVFLLLSDDPESSMTRKNPGWRLTSARRSIDDMGLPAVAFNLDAVGGQYMSSMTRDYRNEHMAIVLDGKVMSAPTIQSVISSSGSITKRSGYSQKEMAYLLQTLNAGSLQERISDEPIYKRSFTATFGADNLEAGLKASLWALIVVAGFMAVYYMFNGLMADFALFGNMAIILGVMSLVQSTFTLPGIAGIVLTIGMAVDANVLIFERIREEREGGAHIDAAVRAGYGKALWTIVDANVTTLITCLVLGYTATTEIKGFAVTLGLGIVATLFTALLCTRTWIELYLQVTKARSLPMMPLLVPAIGRMLHPNINWVGKRFGFIIFSAVIGVAGILMLWQRGQDMYDIEFRSGTQVGFAFKDDGTMTPEQVRRRLDDAAAAHSIPELAGDVAKVVAGEEQRSYTVATLASNEEHRVANAIAEAFDDVLQITREVAFTGDDVETFEKAPIFVIKSTQLGANINRLDVTDDVSAHLGGVAMLIEQMNPPVTLDDVTARIRRLRLQPPHDQYGTRSFHVFGIQPAPATGDDGAIRFKSIAVVVSEEATNYTDRADMIDDPAGLADTEWSLLRNALTTPTSLGSVAAFSPQISGTMRVTAGFAITLSLLAVVAYIWLRFGSIRYGLAAIVALVHDVVIALGIVAVAGLAADSPIGRGLLLTDFKIDLSIVAALLTIVGYSLNDTIVIFDRIRENRGRLTFPTPAIVNKSLNQTMSRTALTSMTTCIALLTLYIFGGPGVHGFAFTMLIGVLVGTYSSVAIAAPIVLVGGGGEPTTSPAPTTAEPA